MLKSTHCALSLLVLPLFFLALAPGPALAQARQSGAVVFSTSPDESPLVDEPSDTVSRTTFVDTVHNTKVIGWTSLKSTPPCTEDSTGEYTVLTAPKHGELSYGIVYLPLKDGSCPGVLFPFNSARYIWTDPDQSVLEDTFSLGWSASNTSVETTNVTVEMAQVKLAKSVWWACDVSGGSLPNTGTLTFKTAVPPPVVTTNYVWTITSGTRQLVFSNGEATTTTTALGAGVKALAASAAANDVSVNVLIGPIPRRPPNYLEYFGTATVRAPSRLRGLPDLNKNDGRGADCGVSGTQGFLSLVGYEVDDQFGVNTFKPDQAEAGINELLGTAIPARLNNWPRPAAGGANTLGGTFVDQLCMTGGGKPQPIPPQNPLTTILVEEIPQIWYAGSGAKPPPNTGCKVQSDTINFFIDHGTHTVPRPPLGEGSDGPLSAAGGGAAYPRPVLNVRYLAERSGVILKGRVLQVNETGAIEKSTENGLLTFHKMAAFFQVDRVLKGNVEARVIAVEFLKNPAVPGLTLEQNEYALLFLNSGQDGRYSFVDPQVGKMVITSQNVPLAQAAETTAAKLEAELMASLLDPDSEVARTALEQVGDLGSVRSTQAIRDLASRGAPDMQGIAYGALLRLGDYSLIDQAIRYAEEPAQDPEMRRLQLGVVRAIGDIEDRLAVPALNSLLASPSVDLRRAAARAMRAIGDPSSAGFLVRALDDSDRDVQYDAGMALAGLAGASPDNAPARDVFDRSPAKYLDHWKNWWETSGKQGDRSSH